MHDIISNTVCSMADLLILWCTVQFSYLLGKGGYVFSSVGFLFVCGQHYSKRYEWFEMKFYGGILGSTVKN